MVPRGISPSSDVKRVRREAMPAERAAQDRAAERDDVANQQQYRARGDA
jgi:hypothetical protein